MFLFDRWQLRRDRSAKYKGRESIWGNLDMKQGLLWNQQRNHRVHNANRKLADLLEECWRLYNEQEPQQYPAHIERLLQQEPILFSLGVSRLRGWYRLRPSALSRLLRCAKQGLFPAPVRVMIPKPGTTEMRPLTIPCKAHRIRMKTVTILLRPLVLTHPEEQHGFRPHHSCATCWKQLLSLLGQHNYVWEFDYRKFYDSISHTAMHATLEALGFPQSLIREVMPLTYQEQGRETTLEVGILQGMPTSPLISLFILNHIGAYHSPMYTYLGYADDGLLFGDNPEIKKILENKVAAAGLTLKPEATKLIKTPEGISPFTFLGVHFDNYNLTLNPRSGHLKGLPITITQLRTLYSPQYHRWQLRDPDKPIVWNYSRRDKEWHLMPRPARIRSRLLNAILKG